DVRIRIRLGDRLAALPLLFSERRILDGDLLGRFRSEPLNGHRGGRIPLPTEKQRVRPTLLGRILRRFLALRRGGLLRQETRREDRRGAQTQERRTQESAAIER